MASAAGNLAAATWRYRGVQQSEEHVMGPAGVCRGVVHVAGVYIGKYKCFCVWPCECVDALLNVMASGKGKPEVRVMCLSCVQHTYTHTHTRACARADALSDNTHSLCGRHEYHIARLSTACCAADLPCNIVMFLLL
jgi:hypothetical protein